ncbi:hypothetical protein ACV3T0_13805 [Clostridium perfringens]
MLKIRITFVDSEKGRAELDTAVSTLEKEYNILNKSRVYPGRGNSQYSNIYLDIEEK